MIGGNNNNNIVNQMQYDKYKRNIEKIENKNIRKKQLQDEQQLKQKDEIKIKDNPESIKINLKNRLNLDTSDIFNNIYDINYDDNTNNINMNMKEMQYCNYSYVNTLKLSYIELNCLRTSTKVYDKKSTSISPTKSNVIPLDSTIKFPYPKYNQDKKYHVREESLYNRRQVESEKLRNHQNFIKDKKKFHKDLVKTLKEWDGIETESMVKRVFTRRRLKTFHRTTSDIDTIINLNTEYEMKNRIYDFKNERDVALFRSELKNELILLESLVELEPIPGLSLEKDEHIRNRQLEITANAFIVIRRFIHNRLSSYKAQKSMELFAKNALKEKREIAIRKIQSRAHLFLLRFRIDRLKIYNSCHIIQSQWRLYRYRRSIKKKKAQLLMESRQLHAVLVIQSYFYPKMKWTREFPILAKFQETYLLSSDKDENGLNFSDVGLIATDIVHKQRTKTVYADASITDSKDGKKNDNFLLMEAKYLYDEGVSLTLSGDYISAINRLETSLDIRNSIYHSADNTEMIEVKHVLCNLFSFIGDYNKSSILYEELLELLTSQLQNISHQEQHKLAVLQKKCIEIKLCLTETKLNQSLINDSISILNQIQEDKSHHHHISSSNQIFELKEVYISAKIDMIKGDYNNAKVNFMKLIDISTNILSKYDNDDDNDTDELISNDQLQYANYLVYAYDNLIEISLLLYNIDESKSLHSQSVMLKSKYFNDNHPTLGISKYYNCRIMILTSAGSYKSLLNTITELIDVERSKYNDNSCILSKFIYLQADIQVAMGLLDDAKTNYDLCRKISDNNLIISLIGNAKILIIRGAYAEAATLIQECLSMKEKLLSLGISMHIEIEELKVLLAKLFCQIGSPSNCKDILKNTGETICKIIGNSDSNIYFSDSLLSLADLHKVKGKFDIANNLYKQALDIKTKALGDSHLTVADIYASMSENMRLSGNLSYAEVYCDHAMKITFEEIGDDNVHYTLLTFLRGRILCDMGDYNDAEIVFRNCMSNISKYMKIEENLHYAFCIGVLGECLRLQGKFTASTTVIEESLAIFKKSFGGYHQIQGEVMLFNAMLLMDLNKVEEALVLLKFKILGKIESVIGSSSPLTIFVYGNISLCQSKVSDDCLSVSPMQSVSSIDSTTTTNDISVQITNLTNTSNTGISRKSFITKNSISYSVKENITNISVGKCISALKKRLSYDDSHPYIIRMNGNFPTKNKEEADAEEAERLRLIEVEEEKERKRRGSVYYH